jgi:hypothetical protein
LKRGGGKEGITRKKKEGIMLRESPIKCPSMKMLPPPGEENAISPEKEKKKEKKYREEEKKRRVSIDKWQRVVVIQTESKQSKDSSW